LRGDALAQQRGDRRDQPAVQRVAHQAGRRNRIALAGSPFFSLASWIST
jgi:hypothetical protein